MLVFFLLIGGLGIMSSLLNQEQIQLLLTTKCTGIKWQNETVLLCVLKKGNEIIFRKGYKNMPRVHAEMVMLNDPDFWTYFQDGQTKIDIFLTMNYSPCDLPSACAAKLLQFYRENKKYVETFTIRFSAVYREQTTGLFNLKVAGVILESMTEKSWFDFLIWNSVDNPPDRIREKIKERDDRTRNELDDALLSDQARKQLNVTSEKQTEDDEDSRKDARKPGSSKKRY